ncbi:MAG: 30S ribosomal protein S2 [Candidatus Moraniibacteriota bacterium]|jgi:small subunit ribosomal protein S2
MSEDKKIAVKKDSDKKDMQEIAKNARKNVFEKYDYDNLELTMPVLLKAGVHFGHQKARRNPKMDQYIFTTRNNINIIDLAKTVELAGEALEFLESVKKSGKQILFVGTKKQSCDLVKDVAEYTENPYVVERWLGGTFTNFRNIRGRTRYMTRLKDQIEKGDLKKYTKFEQMKKIEEAEKLDRRMGGIAEMASLPGAVFVTDLNADKLAVAEANIVGVPVVALVDTNVNPAGVTYPIPANDDAVSSITMMFAHICKALK